jgi:hypothetical protein
MLADAKPRQHNNPSMFRSTTAHPSACAEDGTSRRRSRLLLDVTQAAGEVSRLVHEARDLNLPVEPGVRDGRDALVRWAVLIEEVLP